MGDAAADVGLAGDDVGYRPLDRIDEAEVGGVDGDAGFDAAGQAGLGRQFRQIVQAVRRAISRTVALSISASTKGWTTPRWAAAFRPGR